MLVLLLKRQELGHRDVAQLGSRSLGEKLALVALGALALGEKLVLGALALVPVSEHGDGRVAES